MVGVSIYIALFWVIFWIMFGVTTVLILGFYCYFDNYNGGGWFGSFVDVMSRGGRLKDVKFDVEPYKKDVHLKGDGPYTYLVAK